jgi:stage II sporulation protein M
MKKTNKKGLSDLFRESFSFIRESKKHIFIVSLIFLIFVILGYFILLPTEVETLILQRLKEITQMFEGLNLSQTIWMIFSNNIYVSFISLIFGLLFGIFPIITSISNGFIIGYVIQKAVSIEGIYTIWKLLPHGIFELPAVIISLGMGLRLGSTLIFRNKNLKKDGMKSLNVFLLVVTPLLIIAAIIEGFLVFFIK